MRDSILLLQKKFFGKDLAFDIREEQCAAFRTLLVW